MEEEEEEFYAESLTKKEYVFTLVFFGKLEEYNKYIKQKRRKSKTRNSLDVEGDVNIEFDFSNLEIKINRRVEIKNQENEKALHTVHLFEGGKISGIRKDYYEPNMVCFRVNGIDYCLLSKIYDLDRIFCCLLLIRPETKHYHPQLLPEKKKKDTKTEEDGDSEEEDSSINIDIPLSENHSIRVTDSSRKKINIWSGTWTLPKSKNFTWKSLSSWIPATMDFDIIVFSIQNALNQTSFQNLVGKITQEPYIILKNLSYQQNHICVLIDKVLFRNISNIETGIVQLGRDGASTLAISMNLFTTPFLFVSSNFPFGSKKIEKRTKIYTRRKYFARSISKLRSQIGHPEFDVISQFHYIIWMGLFNYLCTENLSGSFQEAKKIIKENELPTLLQEKKYMEYIKSHDSLQKEQYFHKTVFHNFQEMEIKFPPTFPKVWKRGKPQLLGYKGDIYQQKLSGKGKGIFVPPSYPDRIMTKKLPSNEIKYKRYESLENTGLSDHSPIICEFRVHALRHFFQYPLLSKARDLECKRNIWELKIIKARVSHRNSSSKLQGATLGFYGRFLQTPCQFGKSKYRKTANPEWKKEDEFPVLRIQNRSLEFINQQYLTIGLFDGSENYFFLMEEKKKEEEEEKSEEEEEIIDEIQEKEEKEEEEEEEEGESDSDISDKILLDENKFTKKKIFDEKIRKQRTLIGSTYLPLAKLVSSQKFGKTQKYKLLLKDYDTMDYRGYLYVEVILQKGVPSRRNSKSRSAKKIVSNNNNENKKTENKEET